jgi:type III secretion protein Q
MISRLPVPLHGLSAFTEAEAALLNRLHARHAPWQGQWQGTSLTLGWQAGTPASGLDISAHWGTAPLRLTLPPSLLEIAGTGQGQGIVGAMALEAALLPLLEPLEAASAQPIRLEPLALPLTLFTAVHLDVQWGDHAPVAVQLALSREAAACLADLLDQHPAAPAPLDTLPLPAQINAAQVDLPLADLRSLRPGDVVLFDGQPVPTLCCAHYQAELHREGDRLTLLHPLTRRTPLAMNDTSAPIEPDAALDDLELTLTCQIGQLDLSLKQLQALGEGSVLTLAGATDDGVALMVNGRRLGRGQLVRVGEALGVRVLSFGSL